MRETQQNVPLTENVHFLLFGYRNAGGGVYFKDFEIFRFRLMKEKSSDK